MEQLIICPKRHLLIIKFLLIYCFCTTVLSHKRECCYTLISQLIKYNSTPSHVTLLIYEILMWCCDSLVSISQCTSSLAPDQWVRRSKLKNERFSCRDVLTQTDKVV